MSATLSSLIGAGGGKPKLITSYTSGTGTHVPTEDNARCFVRIQGGGGGGVGAGGAGGGGAMVEVFIRVPIAGEAYVVGAGGGVGVAGSLSSFGRYGAEPGRAGSGIVPGYGGVLGNMGGAVDADSAAMFASSPMTGVAGGGGGYSAATDGARAGYPIPVNSTYSTGSVYTFALTNGLGNGSGGDSFFGVGGAPGAAPSSTDYGAGGGYGAAGAGGYIEIWDFGA